jgi:PII-like signaling protein
VKIEGKGKAVAVYIGETDHWHGKPLYAAIVEKARELGLAGATVTRGIMGFGANSRIHTTAILRLSEDLPVVVQLIDRPERIDLLMKHLDDMVTEGLVCTWDVNIERYVHSQETGS